MTQLRVGPLAIKLLHHFEDCRLEAYLCPANKWTIGWGMTRYPDGRPVRRGDRITQAEADRMFEVLLETDFSGPVRRFVADGAPTSPAQFGALAAFAYNVGTGALKSSTLLRMHKAGNYEGAADQFLRWNKAGGRVLGGLTRRRQAERALYLRDFDALAAFTNGEVA